MSMVAFDQNYLKSDTGFTVNRLLALLVVLQGSPLRAEDLQQLSSKASLIKAILLEKYLVAWDHVLGDINDLNTHELRVERLLRRWIDAKKIGPPAAIKRAFPMEEPLTPVSDSNVVPALVPQGKRERISKETVYPHLMAVLGPGNTSFVVSVIVQDHTTGTQDNQSHLWPVTDIKVRRCGPEDCKDVLFVETIDVLYELMDLQALPPNDWAMYWSLPGFPWVVGPVAQRVGQDPIVVDHGQRQYAEIPLVGKEDVLRIMVVFADVGGYPQISGLEGIHDEYTPPIFEADFVVAEDDDEEDDEDLSETQKKNEKIVQELKGQLSSNAIVQELIKSDKKKQGVPIHQLWTWMQEITKIFATYTAVEMDTGRGIKPIKVSQENWAIVLGRSASWLATLVNAEKVIRPFVELDPRAKDWLESDMRKLGVGALVDLVKDKPWEQAPEPAKKKSKMHKPGGPK
ncbi:hypothetical protein FB45DRAFT_863792 [Roridomyces roridus]|uniref:Uncharacterized protein n=1 Tax=Roridomyces roridus TaxID=1738132 RepID=A0AAD7C514_9AGAR|nr:hypothetical protein FB45DRAFT_863792 [Roridomyces roridus]